MCLNDFTFRALRIIQNEEYLQDSDLDLNNFSNRQGDLSNLKSENKSDENPNDDMLVEATSDKNITFEVKAHFNTSKF